jgi:PPOX class probable F420-dependent enzyme
MLIFSYGMSFSAEERAFLEKNHAAAMVTLRPDGTSHVARVGVCLVDGKLWSSGTPDRVRTGHLRRDPRSTLFVFEPRFGWLGIEARITILDGPDAADQSVRLFQVMQGRAADTPSLMWYGQELAVAEFAEAMRAEKRLIYEFEPLRTYGLIGAPGRPT